MIGNSPADRCNLGTKSHILTDKNGIPISAIISSATKHYINGVTDVLYNMVVKRPMPSAYLQLQKEEK
jgi:hypothetical protein